MGRKQIAAMGMIGALLGAGALVASSTAASANVPTKPAARCTATTDDHWPAADNGRPDVDPHTAKGVYMWHDGAGWHIRVTHRSYARRTFAGRITTAGRFFAVSSVRLEGHDFWRLSPDRHEIVFRFDNHGAIDGLNFRTACAPAISFNFSSNGKPLPAEAVKIGHDGTSPDAVPFTISRSS